MDFDDPGVYGDTSITDGLVMLDDDDSKVAAVPFNVADGVTV